MATRFKEPPTIQQTGTYPEQRVAQHVARHSGELQQMTLPAHPLLGKEPLADATVSEDAPHPIGVDPSVTGAFGTITPADGTAPIHGLIQGDHESVTGVRRRHDAQRKSFPKIVIALVAGIAVCFIAAALLILNNVAESTATVVEEGEGQRVEQTQSAPGEPLYYDSYVYTLEEQMEGGWALVRSAPTEADPLSLFALEGTPVELVLSDGVFVIPENLGGTWDIAAWVIGDGNVETKLMGEDGQPLGGEGELVSATLDDDQLTLTTADGAVTEVPLGFWE